MTIARVIVALLIAALAVYVAVMNWLCAIINLRNQRRGIDEHHSMVPIVSCILIAVAIPIYPYEPRWWFVLIPVFDFGNLNLLRLPFFLIAELRKQSTEQHADDSSEAAPSEPPDKRSA